MEEQLKKLYDESREMAMLRIGSPIHHMVNGALALIATHEKQLLEISSAEASYIVGCIDFDLAEFSDTYSNSQMKFINDLRAKMRAHKESLTKSIERGE